MAFHLTGGEASDSRNFEILLDLGPDIAPRAAITDKGYDAKANRDGARKRGICPVIPYKSNAIDRPAFFPKILYKARARIEQAVGKLKRFKRIALRCEKTAQNYASFVALALGLISSTRPSFSCARQTNGGVLRINLVIMAMTNVISGRQIRAGRVLAGLTQAELVRAAGCHPRSVRYWESKGSNLPTNVVSTLDSIEQALIRYGVIPFSTPTPGVRLL